MPAGETNPQMGFSNQAPSAPPARQDPGAMLTRLQAVLDRFEISVAEANDLVLLQDYRLVVIADDSGSMQSAAEPPHLRQLGAPVKTRWHELQTTLTSIVEIGTCLDPQGIDVYFLNRQPVLGIKHASDPNLQETFQNLPGGTTPLTETLQRVAARTAGEKPVLLLILTDGEPNGGKGPFKRALEGLVSRAATSKLRVQIMACTPEDDEIAWLNELDAELREVDVTNDYFAERQQVLAAGVTPKFTRGDWCMKAMLGPLTHKFDAWDEKVGKRSKTASPECGLCSVQ